MEFELIPLQNVKIDINDMVDKVFIGPQGELLQKVNDFNDVFGDGEECIRISKTWRFKPGVYPAIKKAFNKYVNKFDMKPRGIYSLRDRINDHSWNGRRFWDGAIAIEQDMWRFRQQNNSWVDNTELIENAWNGILGHFVPKIEEFNAENPGYNLKVGIKRDVLEEKSEWTSLQLYTMIEINDIVIKVHRLSNDCAEIPWGNITLRWSTSMWDLLNAVCNVDGNLEVLDGNNRIWSRNPHAKTRPVHRGMEHPYISSHRGYYHTDPMDFIGNVCVGDLDSSLRQALRRYDYEAMAFIATRWLSNYHIPNTNPLNRINKCYYGMPEVANSQLLMAGKREGSVFNPESEMNNCTWAGIMASERGHEIDDHGRLTEGYSDPEDPPCNTCQFKDGYSYAQDDGSVRDYAPCKTANQLNFKDPITDDDCKVEAALMIFMCRQIIQEDSYNPFLMGRGHEIAVPPSSEGQCSDLMHENACIENILELNPDIYLPHFWTKTRSGMSEDVEDVLDRLFQGTRWQDLYMEWQYLNCGELTDENESQIEDFAMDHEHLSIPELVEMIAEYHSNTQSVYDASVVPEVLSPEERVIAWAARNGSAINIGESR